MEPMLDSDFKLSDVLDLDRHSESSFFHALSSNERPCESSDSPDPTAAILDQPNAHKWA